ncbi:hypothetical protein PIB30_080143, partial [Stylosanthes scabra]|nr:hypothetical protein [Stylosanthes scabra]
SMDWSVGYSLNLHPAQPTNQPAPHPILPALVLKLFSTAAVLRRSRRWRGRERVVPRFPCTRKRERRVEATRKMRSMGRSCRHRVVLFRHHRCPLVPSLVLVDRGSILISRLCVTKTTARFSFSSKISFNPLPFVVCCQLANTSCSAFA